MNDQNNNSANEIPQKENHKMKKHTKIILATLAVSVVAVPLVLGVSHASQRWSGHHDFGQRGHMQNMTRIIEEIDINADSTISKLEMQNWQNNKLTSFDKNNDKAIELKEFESLWMEQTHSHMVDKFQQFDEDGNGLVTEEELSAPMAFMFERMDKDGNGEISKDEMKKIYKHQKHYREDDEDNDKD